MAQVAGLKRDFVKEAQTWNVISIGHEENIETLNMQNADGAGAYSRTNILKNIATAADMPAALLENETMVSGFGEGTEDAKNIAGYIESIRMEMAPQYAWCDNSVQYRAWNPEFFKRMQALYPERYGAATFEDAFSEWRRAFHAEWPSLLRESESEQIKVEEVKLEAVVNILEVLMPQLDPYNKVQLAMAAMSNLAENKRLFPYDFQLDYEALLEFFESNHQQAQETLRAGLGEEGSEGSKFTKLDSAKRVDFSRARQLLDALTKKPVRAAA
jgi:hypothetical protein